MLQLFLRHQKHSCLVVSFVICLLAILLISASSPNNGLWGSQLRCNTIYPSTYEVSRHVLKKILTRANASPETINTQAMEIARGTHQMLRNMIRDPEFFILPVAFFAMLKDYESEGHVDTWGVYDFAFVSPYCYSGRCSGYFQVDVDLMDQWNLHHICGQSGLDVLGITGGPDYCAFLFWMLSGDGYRCKQFDYRGDACLGHDFAWDTETFARGYQVYGQAPQWGDRSWAKMYSGFYGSDDFVTGYEQCSIDYFVKHYQNAVLALPAEQQNNRDTLKKMALDKFVEDIGLVLE
ncbi:MAG: hypothetical protein OXC40_03540 [Proteobacteria bacterium]|nr:hypothetical protein [Pseudomonadota bacterium]